VRLCDWFVFDRDDDRNRCRSGPLRATEQADRLRCFACGGWTPYGQLPSIERVALLAREAASILAQLDVDYRWAHSVAFAPTRRSVNGRGSGHGDPTGSQVGSTARARTKDFAAVAARLLERAMRDLRAADEAVGEALQAAEPHGPADHTKAPYHDTVPANRPDLAVAYDARSDRYARGEGIPT